VTTISVLATLVSGLVVYLVTPAHSQELPTFQRIRQTGAIVIGNRDTIIPFSFYDDQRRPVGYTIDICKRIVDAIKAELGLQRLDVMFKEVSAATMIPLVANGDVDMECGSSTNNAARQLQVSFSRTIFISSIGFASKKGANLTSFQSLRGKRVAVVAGTDSASQINRFNGNQQMGMVIVPTKDLAAAFRMLQSDQVEAWAGSDILDYSMIARSKAAADYIISDEQLVLQPFAIMLRKGDRDLKRVADDAIARLFQSGEINQLYDKWFLSPLPRFNVNLNLPMSDALKRVIAHPTDSPNPNDYRE
jgi:glutamate/aspartate transport system substrate-binding protein